MKKDGIRKKGNDKEVFSEKLALLLNKKNLRPYELSDMTGISKALISQYLNDKAVPKIKNIVVISIALDVSPFYWLPDDTPGKEFYCKYHKLSMEDRINVLQNIEFLISQEGG